MNKIDLNNRVAIITGGAQGFGFSMVERFSQSGAKVVIWDKDQELINSLELPDNVSAVQTDVTSYDSVEKSVKETIDKNSKIDILVNNAGILRDKSFHKDTIDSFNIVMDVHFQGTLNCTHTIFPIMREQGYGRIIFTSSSSGVFGNFGQANYGSAKMAMIGLMNTLKLEGQKYNVFTNSITPVAYTRMTEGLIPEDFGKNLQPEFVSPAVLYLASDQAPNGAIMAAGAGVFSRIHIHETMGVSLGTGQDMTPENIAANWDNISDMKDARALQNGGEQTLMIFELLNKDS